MASIEAAPRIRHQCSVTKLMEVNNSLAEECKSQLQTTPFGWLLNLHCNIEASGRILEVMATRWNADARAFQVGDRLIPFTLYDIALILGLPVRGEPIDLEPISFWGAVYDFLVSGLSRAASSMQAKKGRGNLHIQGCTALLQIWACEHLGVGSKNAEINQPFPRFLAWTHQRMYTKKASEAFSKSANVLSVLVAMPWEQDFNVVEEAMETLQETHGSSHPIISRDDGAGPSSIPQTPSNELQLELQAERAEREALARQVRRLKDELDHVKGLVAAVLENSPNIQQNQAATLTKPAPTLTLTKPAPTLTKRAPTLTKPAPSPNPHQTSPNPHQTSPHPHPHKTSPHCHNPIFTPGFPGVGTQNGQPEPSRPRPRIKYSQKKVRDTFPSVCAKILSDPLQLGPRAKTLRQEVHFSYHMQLSDRQELLRSSRNLSQKMTPWHKERSNGLRSQDHILRTQARLCARPVPLKIGNQAFRRYQDREIRHRELRLPRAVFLTRNKLIHKPGCIGKKTHPCTTWNSRIAKIYRVSRNPDRKTALKRTKNTPVASGRGTISHKSKLGFPQSGTLQEFEEKRAGRKTHFSSRTAAFARRVFPARNKLIYEPGCVGKITTPATSWNSRFAESIPRLIGIFTGKVHENSSDTPTSGSHNSLIRTPIRKLYTVGKRTSRAFRRYAA
uniref:Aminotransferase-like plant mobile domain-containing protein n=1 Tax=Fagus sylvatica TaxID=28930 RepID=A0A2N9EMF4_FAGSY